VKRVARGLFAIGTVAAAVLGAAACVLWARSYRHTDVAATPQFRVASHEGGLHLWHQDTDGDGWIRLGSRPVYRMTDPEIDWNQYVSPWAGSDSVPPLPGWSTQTAWRRFGFAFVRAWDLRGVSIPFYAIVAGCTLAPAWSLLRRARGAGRRRQGRCRACGYDLRASPDRCPECGTIAAVNR
jgi:hypothetical protein